MVKRMNSAFWLYPISERSKHRFVAGSWESRDTSPEAFAEMIRRGGKQGTNPIDLWQPFFDQTALQRGQTILHEQIHNFSGLNDMLLADLLDWQHPGGETTPEMASEASAFWAEKLRQKCK